MAAEWAKIRAEYIRGGISYRELAEKYGLNITTVAKKSLEEKWGEKRKKNAIKTQKKIDDKIIEQESEKTVDYLQMCYEINDEAIQHIRELMAVTTDAKSMASYMKALQTAMDIKRTEKSIDGESRRLDIERERLELERLRANASDDENEETGVIVLAPVLPRGGDGDG